MIREIDTNLMRRLFISAAHHLDNNKQAVNDLNVFPVPDGDTGTNMSMTMQNAEKTLLTKECQTAGAVVSAVASATLRGARGNSGVILSQICAVLPQHFRTAKQLPKHRLFLHCLLHQKQHTVLL